MQRPSIDTTQAQAAMRGEDHERPDDMQSVDQHQTSYSPENTRSLASLQRDQAHAVSELRNREDDQSYSRASSAHNLSDSDEGGQPDLEKGIQPASKGHHGYQDEGRDPNVIEWDGPDDPENPQNWPKWRKYLVTIALSLTTFCITFSSSVFSTATEATAQAFGVSEEVTTLGTSLFVLVKYFSKSRETQKS